MQTAVLYLTKKKRGLALSSLQFTDAEQKLGKTEIQ